MALLIVSLTLLSMALLKVSLTLLSMALLKVSLTLLSMALLSPGVVCAGVLVSCGMGGVRGRLWDEKLMVSWRESQPTYIFEEKELAGAARLLV